jgi:hypothetical protein
MTQVLDSHPDLAARFALEAEPLLDALSRRAHRLAFNHAEAEELLQDRTLHAFSGFRTFEPGTNFRAWVFRILHNRWCSTYRSRQRRPNEVLTQFADWETTSFPSMRPRRNFDSVTPSLDLLHGWLARGPGAVHPSGAFRRPGWFAPLSIALRRAHPTNSASTIRPADRRAAVPILISGTGPDDAAVVLTQRAAGLRDHPGEIVFHVALQNWEMRVSSPRRGGRRLGAPWISPPWPESATASTPHRVTDMTEMAVRRGPGLSVRFKLTLS